MVLKTGKVRESSNPVIRPWILEVFYIEIFFYLKRYLILVEKYILFLHA